MKQGGGMPLILFAITHCNMAWQYNGFGYGLDHGFDKVLWAIKPYGLSCPLPPYLFGTDFEEL